jgi:acyl carrier protein
MLMPGSQEEIRLGLAEILNEIAGIDAERIQPCASFAADLKIDSLSMVEVVVAAEERFGVDISDDDFDKLSTIGDVMDYVSRAGTRG